MPNKAQRWVFEAIELIRERLPFELRGIDSDNGAEFINSELFRYCQANQITFTRTRTYRKNDTATSSRRTGPTCARWWATTDTKVRLDLRLLNELYDLARLWHNLFSPQQKLVSKTRSGARVTRRYDVAATPYRRLVASDGISAGAKRALRDSTSH